MSSLPILEETWRDKPPMPLDDNSTEGKLWFTERHTPDIGFQVKVKQKLYSSQSHYQLIEVFDTFEYGRMLTLDGLIMVTERDEFAYHEMMVHVPMLSHPNPLNVLVVGGGDGGCLRELMKYPSLKKAVQVEIDAEVIAVCREYFPRIVTTFEHPKVELVIEDALNYVKSCENQFDVVIVDGSDPVGPAVDLFKRDFIAGIHKVLRQDGIMVNQLGSPFYDENRLKDTMKFMSDKFYQASVYLVHTPSYPSGVWGIGFAAKSESFLKKPDEVRYLTIYGDLKYYNLETHPGAFILPEYIRGLI